MDEKTALKVISALSNGTRLQIIRYLVNRDTEGASAGDVAESAGASSSGASFHLSALENADLVTSERQSRKIIYRANIEKLGGLMSFMLNDCCDGHPDIRTCCLQGSDCC